LDCLFVLIALLSPRLAVALMCRPVEAHSAGVPAARGYEPPRRSRPRYGRSTVCCTGRRSPSDLHVHAGFDDEWQVDVASEQNARRLELSVLRACEHVLNQRSEFLVRQGRELQQPACNRPSSRSDIESTAGGRLPQQDCGVRISTAPPRALPELVAEVARARYALRAGGSRPFTDPVSAAVDDEGTAELRSLPPMATAQPPPTAPTPGHGCSQGPDRWAVGTKRQVRLATSG
jgi:hypothetical protein